MSKLALILVAVSGVSIVACGGGGPAPVPLETFLHDAPATLSADANATFVFSSSHPNQEFVARTGDDAFTPVTSPHIVTVEDGMHTFEVCAVDAQGNLDPTPSTHTWESDTHPPALDVLHPPRGAILNVDWIPVEVDARDAGSGIVELRVNGTVASRIPETDVWRAYVPIRDAQNNIEIACVDAAGHETVEARLVERAFVRGVDLAVHAGRAYLIDRAAPGIAVVNLSTATLQSIIDDPHPSGGWKASNVGLVEPVALAMHEDIGVLAFDLYRCRIVRYAFEQDSTLLVDGQGVATSDVYATEQSLLCCDAETAFFLNNHNRPLLGFDIATGARRNITNKVVKAWAIVFDTIGDRILATLRTSDELVEINNVVIGVPGCGIFPSDGDTRTGIFFKTAGQS